MNNIVFSLSGKAQSGKDTVAEMIKMILQEKFEKSTLVLAYADYLKVICARNFGFQDKFKNRKTLQEFGSKVRAEDENFWMSTTWYTIDRLRSLFDIFVISDTRYENELNPYPWNITYPCIKIFIKREDTGVLDDIERQHESESLATNADMSVFDYIINNNGTLENLYEEVLKIVYEVMDRWDEWFEILKENLEGVTTGYEEASLGERS